MAITQKIRVLRTPDEVIRQAKAAYPDRPITIRMQPQVYDPSRGKSGYYAWDGVHWSFMFDSVADANGFRRAMQAFASALMLWGPKPIIEALEHMKVGLIEPDGVQIGQTE